jgi:hypothetical protein
MFLLNLGSKWPLANVHGVNAAVFLAEGNDRSKMSRPVPRDFERLLFDPQLYLAGLDARRCGKSCSRLATHRWFGVRDLPDQGEMSARDWMAEIRNAIANLWPGEPPLISDAQSRSLDAVSFQVEIGCSHIILPAPLIERREDGATLLGEWLDAGMSAREELDAGQPLLATVAISDAALDTTAFQPGGLLDALIDQTTARDDIDGVYVIVAQHGNRHPFESEEHVDAAYLTLVKGFANQLGTVITNYADVFGLVCGYFGATGFATGASHGTRRLSLDSFRDDGFGIALPHFYSHRCIGEFLSERQLDPIVNARLLRRLRDVTPHSEVLMQTLERGGSASDVPLWAESQNNYREAQRHFIARMAAEGDAAENVNMTERLERVEAWLEDADANRTYLQSRFPGAVGRFAPADRWLTLARG